MSKALMGRAKFKIQRRLGTELPGLGKPGALDRRPYPPGQHGQKRKKISEYTIRLMEKQKVLLHYGLREGQLRTMVKKSKTKATAEKTWVEVLVEKLECRLDNLIFRLGFAPSIPAARQMVKHGHVKVNDKKIDIPSYSVPFGAKLKLTESAYNSQNYLQAQKRPRLQLPAYLKKEDVSGKENGTLVSLPVLGDIPFQFEQQYLIEYYYKLK